MASILKPKSLFAKFANPVASTAPAANHVSPGVSEESTVGISDDSGVYSVATGLQSSGEPTKPVLSTRSGGGVSDNAMLDGVRQQARSILEQCQRECEALREATKQQAIDEGQAIIDRLARQQADQIAQERVQEVLTRVDTLCEALELATEDWLRNWQHETVSLAIKISEKLLVRQIESDPTILLTWIEDMVRLVQGQRRIVIKLSTHDAMQLSDALPELIARLSPGVEFQVVEEPTFSVGSVVLETPETTLDRSLKTQLDRLQQELA